jgi:uncharacterized protein YfaP (DUF2135 family)
MKLQWLLKLAGTLFAVAGIGTASAQFTVDFSSSQGRGTAQDKVLIENIRVQVPIPNPFQPGSYTTSTSQYNVVFRFDASTLHLVPETLVQAGGSNNCAPVTVNVVNALNGSAIPGATVLINSQSATTNSNGSSSFTQMPQGQVSVQVVASGYTTANQVADLNCIGNTVQIALSPASGQTGGLVSGQFRVILTWGQNPSDLDSHMTGPTTTGTRWHTYYGNRQPSGGQCGLDRDDTSSYGPETVTCPLTGTSGESLRPGVYRYSVHHYSGSGNIGTSAASVRLEFANGTYYTYTPPSGFTGSKDVWTVFELTVFSDGSMALAPVNTISNVSSAGSVQAQPRGVIRYGRMEDPAVFDAMPAK